MNSFDLHHINDGHCFLCGDKLTSETRSDEHVVPRWLQVAHELSHQRLTLLNNTQIPYRQLTIPCCQTCNNGPLSEMESVVFKLLNGPYRHPTLGEELRLFQWCSKLLYGLLHRQQMLLKDRSSEHAGTIVPHELLAGITTFHHFMNSIRRPFNFEGFCPYSLFVVETQVFENPRRNFDYFDFVTLGQKESPSLAMVLAIRVGSFGIICVPNDNGLQKQYFQDQFDLFEGIPLHPIQFIEFSCKAAYKRTLLSFTPSYLSIAEQGNNSPIRVIQTNFPNGEIWNDWKMNEYAQLLHQVASHNGWPLPPLDQFIVNDKQSTWLFDSSGDPQYINENRHSELGELKKPTKRATD